MYTNVSNDFLEVLARPSRHFAARFKDNGTLVDLNVKTIKATTGTCGGSQFAVGCAYAGYIEVTAKYTDLLLEGKELQLELGLLLDDDSYEWIPFGFWTVQKPKKSTDMMTFQAVDRMAGKLHEDYETNLTYPATIANVLSELSTNTGLTIHCNLQTTQQIAVPIEGVTQRGALAVIAATLLGNAWIDRNGEVWITSVGGGTSVRINYDYVKTHPEMDEESTEITGVKVYTVAGQTDTWIERGSGNEVVLSDVYMTDTILDAVKSNVIGLVYGGGNVSFMGNPLLDPSDIIYFRGGADMVEYMLVTENNEEIVAGGDVNIVGLDYTSYDVPCMEIVQEFDGGLLTTVSAPGQFEVTEQTYTVGAVTEELRRQAKEIATTQAEAQTAQQSADNAMTTANGKNKIYYQNNAPSSGMSEGDLWFDTDGGNAIYEYKKTGSNPDTYAWTLRQLGQGSIAAGSITANELNVNSLSAISANLGSVNVGGVNNEDGVITIKDANNQTIGYWNNTGINAQAGTIGPWYIGSSGIYNGKSSLNSSASGTYIGTDGISGTDSGGSYTITPGGNLILEDTLSDATQTAVILNIIKQATRNYIQLLPGSLIASNYNSSTPLCTFGVDVYSGVYSGRIGLYSTNGNALYYNAREGRLDFVRTSDGALITNQYNNSQYPLIRNHNNGNISVSASGVGLYLGYENTTNLDFLHGKAAMDANGNFTALGNITSAKTSGQAAVYASNGASKNRIFIYADSSNGQAGLYSYDASNTARAILVRDHNSNDITAYGAWSFNGGVKDYVLTSGGMPIVCVTSNGNRLGQFSASSPTLISVYMQNGTSGSGYTRSTITVSSSDKRMKKNIEDCNVLALPLINAIHMRQFDWISNDEHQNIGFIADELESIDSKLAVGGGYDEENRMIVKSVDTFYLLGYAIKAIQELSAEVSRLKGAS